MKETKFIEQNKEKWSVFEEWPRCMASYFEIGFFLDKDTLIAIRSTKAASERNCRLQN